MIETVIDRETEARRLVEAAATGTRNRSARSCLERLAQLM